MNHQPTNQLIVLKNQLIHVKNQTNQLIHVKNQLMLNQTPPVADERNPCNNAGERQPHCSTNRKGKSLCYVIPALCKNKTVLVISPIISLMVDQVQKLTKTGIRAALLGTAQKENIIQQIQQGEYYRLIFTTPESLPEYGALVDLRFHFPNVPLMTLTATATPQVKVQLLAMLRNPSQEVASINQENIRYHAYELKKLPKKGRPSYYTELADYVVNIVQKQRAIVYIDFVKDVAPLVIALREKGLSTWSFHGKNMSSHDKVNAVELITGVYLILVMVCTTTFGMGVDVPDVEVVVRVGCPSSLEELVQEFGRAGRDGRPAKGVLMFSETDLQHAVYWTKDKTSDEQQTLLMEFQTVWR
ncbi:ATP-dependent DNA helicase RecQ-like [Halichondria panicea]|uniref:ATP-dependent DNA helicase RecQ-like n=1 Tax=Halichondria panicea TaxID=6063 RepID=UPI00312B9B2A